MNKFKIQNKNKINTTLIIIFLALITMIAGLLLSQKDNSFLYDKQNNDEILSIA